MAVIIRPIVDDDPNTPTQSADDYVNTPPPPDSIGTYHISHPSVLMNVKPELFEQHRQFEVMRRNLQPYVDMGPGSLAQLRGADTAGGLDARLGEIFGTDAFRRLSDERTRAVKHQLNQAGMLRSDAALRELANVPLEIGLGLEEQLFNRSAGLAGNAQNAAAGLGAAGVQYGQAMGEQMRADRVMREQKQAEKVNQMATFAALMFSDKRLKANVRAIGRLGPLNWYRWDWVPGAPNSGEGEGEGVIAQEVMALFPEYVHPIGHFLAVDYAGLMAAVRQRAPLVEVAA